MYRQYGLGLLTAILVVFIALAIAYLDSDGDWDGVNIDDVQSIRYEPQRLPIDGFRILEILPGETSHPNRCSIISAQLPTNISFDALSYQWGSKEHPHAIYVGNIKTAVTENLWRALKAIRHPTQTTRVWVDAICINQLDDIDKASQLPLMSYIYHQAKTVIIYLGPHQPKNHLHHTGYSLNNLNLARQLSAVTQRRDSCGQDDLKCGNFLSDAQKQIEASIAAAEYAHSEMMYLLHALVHEEYWKRAWIVQEVILASKNLVVLHGKSIVPWSKFLEMVVRYQHYKPEDTAVSRILDLDRYRNLKSRTGSVFTLPGALDVFRDAFTSGRDQNGIYHDKIYAFLGFSHGKRQNTLPISYKKTAAEVYHDVLKYFWEGDQMTREQKSIELPYFSALVRRLISREPAMRPLKLTFVEDPDSKWYLHNPMTYLLAEVVLKSVGGLLLRLSTNTYRSSGGRWHHKARTWYWKPSKPENASLWLPDRHYYQSALNLSIRGVVVDEIKELRACSRTNCDDIFTRCRGFSYKMDRSCQILTDHHAIMNQFRGVRGSMGAVPSTTVIGDLIVQFWNTNASAVIRRGRRFTVVGRADLLRTSTVSDDVSATLNGEIFGLLGKDVVDLSISVETLTNITLDTVFLDGT